MFVIYKKLTSPDASPVLGPSSPNMKPTDISASSSNSNSNSNSSNSSNSNSSSKSNSNSSSKSSSSIIEPFSLYNCCCSPRNHASKSTAPEQGQGQGQGQEQGQDMPHPDGKCHQCPVESKYAFGHATHYTYIATTPRLLCEFETGTP